MAAKASSSLSLLSKTTHETPHQFSGRNNKSKTKSKIGLLYFLILFVISGAVIRRSFLVISEDHYWTDRIIDHHDGVHSQVGDLKSSSKNRSSVPDGDLNGLPLYYKPYSERMTTSNLQCVGENFRHDAWQYRSCNVQHFCYNTSNKEFFVVASQEQIEIEDALSHWWNGTFYGSISSRLNATVSLKTMVKNLFYNAKPGENRHEVLPWQPSIRLSPPMEGYYELPSHIVWIPIHTLTDTAVNPGHLLWDHFLPIYNLLSMFGYENTLTPFVTDQNRYCTFRRKQNGCYPMIAKFIPLLGVPPDSFRNTVQNFNFNIMTHPRRSDIVCAQHALIGIGMLNDHGRNKHGQAMTDYERMRNMGRGPALYRFRNFMLHNMDIMGRPSNNNSNNKKSSQQKSTHEKDAAFMYKSPPYQIFISQNSSNSPHRRRMFERQILTLQQEFASSMMVSINAMVLMNAPSFHTQLQIMTESTVYIGVMGGGAAMASFLPRGSTVILYYDDVHDLIKTGQGSRSSDRSRQSNGDGSNSSTAGRYPVMMDWDFFNNAAYLNVHWFPLSTMDNKEDLTLLVTTIRNDLQILKERKFEID